MLLSKKQMQVGKEASSFIQTLLDARGYKVQPITPEIAARSQSPEIPQRDPADRLIAATAMVGRRDEEGGRSQGRVVARWIGESAMR